MTSLLGHHARYVAATFFSGREVVVVLLGAGVILCLLVGPVIGEILLNSFSARATRVAPRVFLVGLGILLTGLVVQVEVLDVVGACLIGAVLLGAILANY